MVIEQLFPPAGHWPIALSKLATEMGVSERALVDAARTGKLKAWRIGGDKRGELITTLSALTEYYAAQPAVAPRARPAKGPTPYELAVAAAKAKPLKSQRRAA